MCEIDSKNTSAGQETWVIESVFEGLIERELSSIKQACSVSSQQTGGRSDSIEVIG